MQRELSYHCSWFCV